MRRVRKISDRFQANHGGYLIAARLASASVNKTPHFIRQKVRRFLVHKRDEAQRVLCRLLGETAGEREHCRNAAAVVVGAGPAEDGIVMRTDEKNFRTGAADFRFDIVAGSSVKFVSVAARLQKIGRAS